MSTVLLLRHGETAADADQVLAGWDPDVHLNDYGREQARESSARLAEVRFAAVITSPMESCRETTDLVAARRRRDLPRFTDVDLADCRFGEWTGLPVEVAAKEPTWDVLDRHPSAAQFPGGESFGEVQARSARAIRRWNRRLGSHATYVVVTHTGVIKVLLADALGMHLDHMHRIEIAPGSISVINYLTHRPTVSKLNDTGGDLGVSSTPRSFEVGSA